ncbi:hypothetical protein ILUMI_01931 [Ignelater luminosus]|uniref:Transposase Tc1-like domain-containing protein n=1 Tax=Ignelater luminosus TaxID=2038154 RepID=A0A8K0DDG9_IGNLU|nr:hypothetical protein ILUMI_01931 [Ignelater luminosus]
MTEYDTYSGRKCCITERDDRFIVSKSLRNRRFDAVQVQQELREVRGMHISQWTVRLRLQQSNLTPKNPAYRQARLNFARDHLNLTWEQWGSVLFSDEIRICFFGSYQRKKVYRRPGERFVECYIENRIADLAFITRPGRGRERGGLTVARYVLTASPHNSLPKFKLKIRPGAVSVRVHQTSLRGKLSATLKNAMDGLAKLINFMRSCSALQHRQFKEPLSECDSAYSDLLQHNNVRSLSKDEVIERFWHIKGEVSTFLGNLDTEEARK